MIQHQQLIRSRSLSDAVRPVEGEEQIRQPGPRAASAATADTLVPAQWRHERSLAGGGDDQAAQLTQGRRRDISGHWRCRPLLRLAISYLEVASQTCLRCCRRRLIIHTTLRRWRDRALYLGPGALHPVRGTGLPAHRVRAARGARAGPGPSRGASGCRHARLGQCAAVPVCCHICSPASCRLCSPE